MNELLDKLQEHYRSNGFVLMGTFHKVFQMIMLLNTMVVKLPDAFWEAYGKLNRN